VLRQRIGCEAPFNTVAGSGATILAPCCGESIPVCGDSAQDVAGMNADIIHNNRIKRGTRPEVKFTSSCLYSHLAQNTTARMAAFSLLD
jgi:hypothetical protein